MSAWSTAWTVSEAVSRLRRRDLTLADITLFNTQLTDEELAELVDCLLARPDVVTAVWLGINRLTDATGVKLARYLAASSTIYTLDLSTNIFGDATYLALAAALRINSSLRFLNLSNNQAVNQIQIEAAFVQALRLNPDRPAESMWWLYSSVQGDFEHLKNAADQLGHPSLQLLLALRC